QIRDEPFPSPMPFITALAFWDGPDPFGSAMDDRVFLDAREAASQYVANGAMTIPTEPIGSIPRGSKIRKKFATESSRRRELYRWNSLGPQMTAVFHHSATTLRPRGKRRLRRFGRVWRERRWRNKLSMADRLESEDESKQLRSTLLETAASILQIRQRAEQEIRQTNQVLEQRTRELGHALMVLRATLDSTTDAILVTDEKYNLTEFNEKYIDMWKVPRQVLESGMLREVQELTSQNFADSQGFIARIEQIVSSERESFDLLELKDGRIFERYSKVLTIDGQRAGRVWSFRDVTERHLAEITSHRLAAIVASSDDAIIGKNLNSVITSWNFGA